MYVKEKIKQIDWQTKKRFQHAPLFLLFLTNHLPPFFRFLRFSDDSNFHD
jgi:hypothetical protein